MPERWRQWLAAERGGTGLDAIGKMRAPAEVFARLFSRDPSACWLEVEPLKNIEACREVFATESVRGDRIREAGKERRLPVSPTASMGFGAVELLNYRHFSPKSHL